MRILDEFVRREASAVRETRRPRERDRTARPAPPLLVEGIVEIEAATPRGRRLHVRLAIDYSGRDAIWYAAERAIRSGQSSREHFAWAVRSGRGEPGARA